MRTKPIPETAAFGIDIDRKVFHVVALNAAGAVIQCAGFSRDMLMAFFDAAPKTLVGMEACPGSQWLARRLVAMGHDARIIPARFVKPYVKSNKTDTVDAAAIAKAVTRPTMRFVEVRMPEQVNLQALHRICDRLVEQRTALMNQARGLPQKKGSKRGASLACNVKAMRHQQMEIAEMAQKSYEHFVAAWQAHPASQERRAAPPPGRDWMGCPVALSADTPRFATRSTAPERNS